MTTRRQQAANHVRSRVREVAGELATITRGSETVVEDITIVKISSDKLIQGVGGDYVLEADEHAWLIGVDVCGEDLEVGDLITVNEIEYRICESSVTQRHWQWWDTEQTQKVYSTKVWQ
jgi:hypothetical protein